MTDDVPMLRDGEIMATFAIDGIGAAIADSMLVDDVADAVQGMVAQAPLGPRLPSSPRLLCR